MASSASTRWTAEEDKRFEMALAKYSDLRDTTYKWAKVAAMVGGGKTAADAQRHYHLLLDDIESIELGRVPFPMYRPTTTFSGDVNQRRMGYLKLQ